MNKYRLLLFAVFAVFSLQSCAAEPQQEEETRAKNIILLIGDGMSATQIHAAMLSVDTPLNIEQFKNIGFIKTSSSDNLITDSAAAGTALASGTKTKNGAIGVDPEGNPVKSILELASENGLSTGVVASCAITHATPASFLAHQPSRNMAEEIALDFLNSDFDVLIGGGKSHFEKREDNRNLLEELEAKGYQMAYTMEEANQVNSGRLAAFVADGHPVKMLEDRGDMLPDATEKAISILSQNDEGFFLIVESSQIDWAGHDNDLEYVITEMIDFDNAIGRALDFARNDGETLVIVTGDHETGGMTLGGLDPETGKITANFSSGGHTAIMLPVFATGPGAEAFTGIYENTGIFDRMLEAYGFSLN